MAHWVALHNGWVNLDEYARAVEEPNGDITLTTIGGGIAERLRAGDIETVRAALLDRAESAEESRLSREEWREEEAARAQEEANARLANARAAARERGVS